MIIITSYTRQQPASRWRESPLLAKMFKKVGQKVVQNRVPPSRGGKAKTLFLTTFFGFLKISVTFGLADTSREPGNVADAYPKRKNHYNLVTHRQTDNQI